YADINAIFDLLQLRSPGKDSQGGFNIHLMALVIPVSELGRDQQIVGVYATTSRRRIQILRDETGRRPIRSGDPQLLGPWVQGANPDDPGFSRLSIFGGDTLISQIQPGFGNGVIPGGWPNGRRFGDDVVDIAVTALISNLRVNPPIIRGPAGDNLDFNDMAYNKVFPYESTPQNGRNHSHP